MTRQEAISILRQHNAWRRYDGPIGEGPEMVDPKALGEAIDVVCDAMEKELTWQEIAMILAIYEHCIESGIISRYGDAQDVQAASEEILRRFHRPLKTTPKNGL